MISLSKFLEEKLEMLTGMLPSNTVNYALIIIAIFHLLQNMKQVGHQKLMGWVFREQTNHITTLVFESIISLKHGEIDQGKFHNEQNFIKGKLKRIPLTSCRAAAKHTFLWSIFSSTAFGLSKKWVSARCRPRSWGPNRTSPLVLGVRPSRGY